MGARAWSWHTALFYSGSISLCIVIDILQHSSALAFLPQSLEDKGHDASEIAAVIGCYYWAGFLGGALITIYQVRRLVWGEREVLTWSHIRFQVIALIVFLAFGAVALLVEGLYSTCAMHMATRFAQGFCGAFLFFFTFLLSIVLFEPGSPQQMFALTLTSISLHCAEVFGPFIGASIFVQFGPRMPFFVLAGMSCVNQVLLLVMLWTLPSDSPESAPLVVVDIQSTGRGGLMELLSSGMFWRSVLVVAPAAMVKASLESVLPLFADHRLRYDEFQVGLCFTLVAVAFLATSMLIGKLWSRMSKTTITVFVAASMVSLGLVACSLLLSFEFGGPWKGIIMPVEECWDKSCEGGRHSFTLFYIWLILFGIASAGCFTPGTFLLGEFIDSVQDTAMKDTANAIWNTLWEVGGSLGFLVAGLPNANSWREEHMLLVVMGVALIIFAGIFVWVSGSVPGTPRGKATGYMV